MVGAAPSFSEVHLVRTLLVLGEGKAGRKSLVRVLGVGEGSVRTIIKKLMRDGLIKSKPRGHELSAKGRNIVNHYLNMFTTPQLAELDVAPSKKCCMVVLHKALDRVTTGLKEREIAVRAGADGAVLLKLTGSGITFPCEDISLDGYPETKRFLDGKNLVEDDVVVIGFSDSAEKAVDGALSIALDMAQTRNKGGIGH